MCNQLIFSILDFFVLEFGNRELTCFLLKPLKALRKFWEKGLHPSPTVSCESNLRVIKVELFVIISTLVFCAMEGSTNLDRPFLLYIVGKTARIKVGIEGA